MSAIGVFTDGLCGVRRRAHARLLQRLLLVPCRLHTLLPVLGARAAERRSELRHADGQAPPTTAAEAQPSPGVSATTGGAPSVTPRPRSATPSRVS